MAVLPSDTGIALNHMQSMTNIWLIKSTSTGYVTPEHPGAVCHPHSQAGVDLSERGGTAGPRFSHVEVRHPHPPDSPTVLVSRSQNMFLMMLGACSQYMPDCASGLQSMMSLQLFAGVFGFLPSVGEQWDRLSAFACLSIHSVSDSCSSSLMSCFSSLASLSESPQEALVCQIR